MNCCYMNVSRSVTLVISTTCWYGCVYASNRGARVEGVARCLNNQSTFSRAHTIYTIVRARIVMLEMLTESCICCYKRLVHVGPLEDRAIGWAAVCASRRRDDAVVRVQRHTVAQPGRWQCQPQRLCSCYAFGRPAPFFFGHPSQQQQHALPAAASHGAPPWIGRRRRRALRRLDRARAARGAAAPHPTTSFRLPAAALTPTTP